MAEVRKAYIHHKDSNPLNNNPSNWEVLCPKCHATCRKNTNNTGFYIAILFHPWLREEILKAASYRCQQCFTIVGDIKHKRCDWCGHVTTKATEVEWKDGRTMCRECFDNWRKTKKENEFSFTA